MHKDINFKGFADEKTMNEHDIAPNIIDIHHL